MDDSGLCPQGIERNAEKQKPQMPTDERPVVPLSNHHSGYLWMLIQQHIILFSLIHQQIRRLQKDQWCIPKISITKNGHWNCGARYHFLNGHMSSVQNPVWLMISSGILLPDILGITTIHRGIYIEQPGLKGHERGILWPLLTWRFRRKFQRS